MSLIGMSEVLAMDKVEDLVNRPAHYLHPENGVECILALMENVQSFKHYKSFHIVVSVNDLHYSQPIADNLIH